MADYYRMNHSSLLVSCAFVSSCLINWLLKIRKSLIQLIQEKISLTPHQFISFMFLGIFIPKISVYPNFSTKLITSSIKERKLAGEISIFSVRNISFFKNVCQNKIIYFKTLTFRRGFTIEAMSSQSVVVRVWIINEDCLTFYTNKMIRY